MANDDKPEDKPADDTPEISEDDQKRFNAMLKAGMKEVIADLAPAPDKTTSRPKGITELLFGSGK